MSIDDQQAQYLAGSPRSGSTIAPVVDTQYEDLLVKVMAEGAVKSDRTGTGTYSLFGQSLRYDLSKGFPLITTKKVHLHSVVTELLWFLRGDSNVRWLQERGVTIWDEWRRPYAIETRDIVFVEPRIATPAPAYIGDFSGRTGSPQGSVESRLAETWQRMMRRCYDPTDHRYRFYGKQGVTVHPRWHDLKTFIEDAQKLPHWAYKVADWSGFDLDKDYFGSNQYGPETSLWLSEEENRQYMKSVRPVRITDNHGTSRTFLSQSIASSKIGIAHSTLSRLLGEAPPQMLKGKNKRFSEWTFEYAPEVENRMIRLEIIEDGELGSVYGYQWRSWPTPDGGSVDQIAELLHLLRTDPDSRRMIVSAWNVADLDKMALPACHAYMQFYVARGKLSCHLYQRSADLFLGVPFNIASYALLTHLIADQVGLEVGEFVWTGGDCHIYSNHTEQVHKQVNREPFPFPKVQITPRDSLFEHEPSDVSVVGYQHHPGIKAPVAV